jgi:serine/threonine protein kinase
MNLMMRSAHTHDATLERLPADALREDEQNRLAEILDAYLAANEAGAAITPAELLERHPQDAAYLRAYLSGLALLDAAAGGLPPSGSPNQAPLFEAAAGRSIGEFRLVREIGRGGMGVVYEAVQTSLRRRVALKVLPPSASRDGKQLARFKNEAQSAAQIHHPNIVPVYAVGEADGVHYFAMQLIEGRSLAELCGAAAATTIDGKQSHTWDGEAVTIDARPMSQRCSQASRSQGAATPFEFSAGDDPTAAIARLGVQAADALHAAHEYGVIHRDVKPSNLLVDRAGRLWVADFGLARFRQGSDLTRTGDLCGTMRYMSPEQAQGLGSLVDHRTDVYSLGVTLYELATGHHPAGDATDFKRLFDRQGLAAKPLRQWNARIPADFETIVMKAIAEPCEERYATAKALADDLRRFLAGEPILATPPGRLTRLRKWAVRHKRGVAAVAGTLLVCLVAVAYAAGAYTMADQAMGEARRNSQSMGKMIYDVPLATAEQLAAIPGAEGVRRQLLEQTLAYYSELTEQSFDDPALERDLALAYSKIGGLTAVMGDPLRAIEFHRKAQAILQRAVDAEPDNADYARSLASCRNNAGLLLAGLHRDDEAIVELQAAQHLQELLLGDGVRDAALTAELATTYSNLGLVAKQRGERVAAGTWFRRATALAEPFVDEFTADAKLLALLAAAHNNLGSLQEPTEPTAAGVTYQRAIELQLRLCRLEPLKQLHQSELARLYNNLGYAAALASDWGSAEQAYREALELQKILVKRSPAESHRRDLAVTYNNRGMALSQAGRLDAALESFELALELDDALLAARPGEARLLSEVGGILNNLGMLHEQRRLNAAAETAFTRAIDAQRQALDAEPDNAATRALLSKHYFNCARLLRSTRRHAEALELCLERRALWAGNAERLLGVARELGELHRDLAAAGDSARELREAVLAAGIDAVREAAECGLSAQRLEDPLLAAFREGDGASPKS